MSALPLAAVRPENATELMILSRLDASLLDSAACFFAGGTAISLRCGEHRVSRDLDFLRASPEGYRLLRQRAFAAGAAAFLRRKRSSSGNRGSIGMAFASSWRSGPTPLH